jgi:hypothetical protein
MPVCMSVCMSVYLSVCLPVCPAVSLSVSLSLYIHFCLFDNFFVCFYVILIYVASHPFWSVISKLFYESNFNNYICQKTRPTFKDLFQSVTMDCLFKSTTQTPNSYEQPKQFSIVKSVLNSQISFEQSNQF